MSTKIYHNPACGTSRKVLAMLVAAGETPQVIEYLKTGWSRAELSALFAAAGLTPKTALRADKPPAAELGLTGEDISDDTILDAMVAHPILVNRPIVTTAKGSLLCRPAERVYDLLAAKE